MHTVLKVLVVENILQVVDAANVLIQDDERVGTILLVMAKHGMMEWVPAKQNLRPVSRAAGGLFCHILSWTIMSWLTYHCCIMRFLTRRSCYLLHSLLVHI